MAESTQRPHKEALARRILDGLEEVQSVDVLDSLLVDCYQIRQAALFSGGRSKAGSADLRVAPGPAMAGEALQGAPATGCQGKVRHIQTGQPWALSTWDQLLGLMRQTTEKADTPGCVADK